MKKTKQALGFAFLAQAVAFTVVFFILWNRKRNLAKVFAAVAAAGGVAGTILLLSDMQDKYKKKRLLALEDCCDGDDDFEDCFDDDISCNFEDEFDDIEAEPEV